jgi:type II secretory pathway pseudopilin PulG
LIWRHIFHNFWVGDKFENYLIPGAFGVLSKNVMGGNRQRLGFSLVELIFILALMGAFAACFAIKPFRSKDDVVYRTKVALSEAVFLARLHSMASGALGVYKAPAILTLEGGKELEVKKNRDYYYLEKKYSKRLDSRISECKLVNFPSNCRSSNLPKNSFQAGNIPQEKVIFEEKFSPPFQLRFLLDGQECYITVDTNAQTQVYR